MRDLHPPQLTNDVRIYTFLEEVYALPAGNPIEPFELSDDIIRYLKEQWAGLFQRLMQESARQKEVAIIESLKSTAQTLNSLVTYLTEERSKGDKAITQILLATHPAFDAIKSAAKIQYRVVFYTVGELDLLLKARQYKKDEATPSEGFHEWDKPEAEHGIRVAKSIFEDDGRLRAMTPEEWDSDFVAVYKMEKPKDDDDIPF